MSPCQKYLKQVQNKLRKNESEKVTETKKKQYDVVNKKQILHLKESDINEKIEVPCYLTKNCLNIN